MVISGLHLGEARYCLASSFNYWISFPLNKINSPCLVSVAIIEVAPREGNDHDNFAMRMKSGEEIVGRNCLAKFGIS